VTDRFRPRWNDRPPLTLTLSPAVGGEGKGEGGSFGQGQVLLVYLSLCLLISLSVRRPSVKETSVGLCALESWVQGLEWFRMARTRQARSRQQPVERGQCPPASVRMQVDEEVAAEDQVERLLPRKEERVEQVTLTKADERPDGRVQFRFPVRGSEVTLAQFRR